MRRETLFLLKQIQYLLNHLQPLRLLKPVRCPCTNQINPNPLQLLITAKYLAPPPPPVNKPPPPPLPPPTPPHPPAGAKKGKPPPPPPAPFPPNPPGGRGQV